MHEQIIGVALERERAFLSLLSANEVEVLLGMFRRLYENLPAVESASQVYVQTQFPQVAARRRPPTDDD